jgi:hypothetical protein
MTGSKEEQSTEVWERWTLPKNHQLRIKPCTNRTVFPQIRWNEGLSFHWSEPFEYTDDMKQEFRKMKCFAFQSYMLRSTMKQCAIQESTMTCIIT